MTAAALSSSPQQGNKPLKLTTVNLPTSTYKVCREKIGCVSMNQPMIIPQKSYRLLRSSYDRDRSKNLANRICGAFTSLVIHGSQGFFFFFHADNRLDYILSTFNCQCCSLIGVLTPAPSGSVTRRSLWFPFSCSYLGINLVAMYSVKICHSLLEQSYCTMVIYKRIHREFISE